MVKELLVGVEALECELVVLQTWMFEEPEEATGEFHDGQPKPR